LVVLSLSAQADIWSTAYYAGWMQDTMPASNVDFTAVSHVIHFSVVPNSNGSLNSTVNGVTSTNSSDVVSRVHAAGRKVLISVGGADSQTGFQGATSVANRPTRRERGHLAARDDVPVTFVHFFRSHRGIP